MNSTEELSVGSKVIIACGVDGKTEAKGQIIEVKMIDDYPYIILLDEKYYDVVSGQELDMFWRSNNSAILKVLECPQSISTDPIEAYNRAMKGI